MKHFALLAVVMLVGCSSMSQKQRLYMFHASYTEALTGVNVLLQNNVIKDQKTKDAIWKAKNECHDGLAEADKHFYAGDSLGIKFALNRIESALGTLIRIHLDYTRKEPVSWISPQLQRYLQRFSPTLRPQASSLVA